MSCVITYKGNKYTQEQFKEYISSNKNEFSHIIASNKSVINSFKRKMESIDYVFSQSPELAPIGSKAQYLQYLSTIFKTSKVNDIVYHGSPKSKLEKVEGISFWTNEKGNAYAYNIERNNDNSEGFVTSAIVNIKNPYIHQEDVNSRFTTTTPKDLIDSAKSKNADGAIWKDVEDIGGRETQTVVFEPEQIHILGSKQDTEGFKEFVNEETDLPSPQEITNKYLIKELGVIKQEALVNNITAMAVKTIVENKDLTPTQARDKAFAEVMVKLKSLKDTFEGEGMDSRYLEFVNNTINNFDRISWLVNIKLQKINNIIGDIDDIDLDDNDTRTNERVYNNKTSYEENFKISAELKRLFTSLETGKLGILREPELVDFFEVDNILKAELVAVPPKWELVRNRLENVKGTYPWMGDLIAKLESSEQIRNMFSTEYGSQHYVEHTMAMWETSKDGGYSFNIQIVNEQSLSKQLIDHWKSVFTQGKYVNDGHIITPEGYDEIKERYDKLTASNPAEVRGLLEDLGIVLPDKMWDSIVDGQFEFNKDTLTFDQFIKRPINFIIKELGRKGVGKSIEEGNHFSDRAVDKLAKTAAKFNSNIYPSTHRSGGKTVNSYGLNKFIVDWKSYLKNEGVAQKIMESPFTSTSIFLTNFKNGNTAFTDNFKIDAVGLQSLKKHHSKDKEGAELHNLTDAEYEYYKIIGLHSSITDVSGNNQRIIKPLFLTTSDKSTAHGMNMVAFDISFDEKGYLTRKSLNLIYNQMVLPEIRRIKKWENVRDTNGFTNSEIELGGHMFHMFPGLNNLDIIWEESGNLNYNVENPDATVKEAVYNEIWTTVNNLVTNKLQFWNKHGLNEMLNLDIIKEKGVLTGVTKENFVRAAATDVVFQSLLTNANIFTAIIGDPAAQFKSTTFKETRKQLVDNGTISAEQAKDTAFVWTKFTPGQRIKSIGDIFDNIGKRLAGSIAPGKQPSESADSTITYLLVNDKALESKMYSELEAIIGEEAAKAFGTGPKGALSETTNAQEFTTMLEHLYNMHKSGLLIDGLYDAVEKIVTKEIGNGNHYYNEAIVEGLNPEHLKAYKELVLQVTKPMYYWNEINPDWGIIPVYVKSSAYPLTPDLKGRELDKVRIMMEKKKVQRLAFRSGTKLGMPKEAMSLWDKGGKLMDFDAIPDDVFVKSTKVLSRQGFRFQQEVPYEKLKDVVNRVSQADKNLFTNILQIGGFTYNGKKYSGKELRDEYNKVYGELYQIGYDELIDELGITFNPDGTIKSLNTDKLRELLIEGAYKRDYPLNDIDALELDQALEFLSFMPSADKYEALLNSIVKNRILKMKFRGKSYVLSTEEGYNDSMAFEDVTDTGDFIFTENWTGELSPGHFENAEGKKLTGAELKQAFKDGTVVVKKPAQVLLPWKFQHNGELLDIKQFIDKETGRIDVDKLPNELLQILGMRIPNQGHNSQSWMEIAGFIPPRMGDIVVATRDFLAQMGSDFDVDKLFTYSRNYFYSIQQGQIGKLYTNFPTGEKLEKVRSSLKDKVKTLKEKLTGNKTEIKELREELDIISEYISDKWKSSEKFTKKQQDILDSEISLGERLAEIRGIKDINSQLYQEIAQVYDLLKVLKNANKYNLQNQVLDIHIAIQANTNSLIQAQVYEPLGFWKFKDIADEIYSIQPVDLHGSFLSDSYQMTKRLNAAMGKALVGDFANGLMFIAAAQGNNLYLHNDSKERNRLYIQFGNKISNGDLSSPYTLDTLNKLISEVAKKEKLTKKQVVKDIDKYTERILDYIDINDITYRSQVMSGLLSSAVDNEKEQILDKLFLNSNTSKFAKLLTLLGFTEEAAYFTRQPIIVDYFNELKRLRSSLGDYNPNAEQMAKDYALSRYPVDTVRDKKFRGEYLGSSIGAFVLKNAIINPDGDLNYVQQEVFRMMEHLQRSAQSLQSIQSAINTDSKGLDKGLIETMAKEDSVEALSGTNVMNVYSLLGTLDENGNIVPETIWGYATVKGLMFNNKLWSELFPYNLEGIKYLFNRIENLVGKGESSSYVKSTLRRDIWKHFRSYIYSMQDLGLFEGDVTTERKRLLHGKDSLAHKIEKVKALPRYSKNAFLQRLNPDPKKNEMPSIIKMNASVDQTGEMLVMQAALDMYVNEKEIPEIGMTSKELFKDLVTAAYLTGGIQEAIQYVRFLPISYLFESGVATNIGNLVGSKMIGNPTFLNIPTDEMPYWVLPNFVIDYVQHYTKGIPQLSPAKVSSGIKVLESNKNIVGDVKTTRFVLQDKDMLIIDKDDTGTNAIGPHFLIINDKKRGYALSKDVLFIHLGEYENGYPIYERISNKGIFGYVEADANATEITNSTISVYNAGNTVESKRTSTPTSSKETGELKNNTSDKANPNKHLDLLGIVSKGDTKILHSIVDRIAQVSDDPFQKILAEEMSKNFDKIAGVNFDGAFNEDGISGRYSPSSNTVKVNVNDARNKGLNGLSETILHETQHAFINRQIDLYEQNPKNVTPEVRQAVAEMKRLQSLYRARVKADYPADIYEDSAIKVRTGKYSLVNANIDVLRVYAAESLKDFATLSLTNRHIQEDLNKHDDPEQPSQSMFKRFIDTINKLLQALGFDVRDNGLLKAAIKNNIVIISSRENMQEDTSQDSFKDAVQGYTGEDLDTDLPSTIPTKEQIYKKFKIFRNDRRRLYLSREYQVAFKKAQEINKGQNWYIAKVENSPGESIVSRENYYVVDLKLRSEASLKEKMDATSSEKIKEMMKICLIK